VHFRLPRKQKPQLTEEEYEIERVVGRRPVRGGKPNDYEYEVKWAGYDDSQNTWERLDNLDKHAMQAVLDFESERQASEIGAAAVDDDEDNVCAECGLRCTGPVALLVHRYHQHQQAPASPDHIEIAAVDARVLRALQESAAELRFIYDHLEGKQNDSPSPLAKFEAKILATHVFVRDNEGLLYCIDNDATKTRVQARARCAMRACIPMTLKQQVMHAIHTTPLSAHPGITRMIDKMRQYVWWPGMYADIVQYVTACVTCQRVKAVPAQAPTQSVRLPTRPWQQIGIDLVEPLPD
jgi:hypothetical protein